jgi:hypothetical protein
VELPVGLEGSYPVDELARQVFGAARPGGCVNTRPATLLS